MVSRFLSNFTRSKPSEELPTIDQSMPLVKKQGYVLKYSSNGVVTVNIDGETEPEKFSLTEVAPTFIPRKYDKIVLSCEEDENSNEITVRQIDPLNKKEIRGKVTSVEPEIHGFIDNYYMFFWEALAENAADINVNDQVTAICIECENPDGNDSAWRCLEVTRTYQPTCNVDTPVQDKETMNKNGIEITENVSVVFNDINETKDIQMIVKNTSSDNIIVLKSLFIGESKISQLRLDVPTRDLSFTLEPGGMKEYKFVATSKRFGMSYEHFKIIFNGAATGKFTISRFIKVDVHDTERQHRTIGTGSNVHTNLGYTLSVLKRESNACIPSPPAKDKPNFVFNKFEEWPIPKILCNTALNPAASRTAIFDALATVRPHFKDILNAENYSHTFHDLLHLEECAMEHNIRIYDMRSYFTREGQYLALTVQNVAESRPSIIVGDYIRVRELWAKDEDKKLERRGSIQEVRQNQILVKFDDGFHEKYNDEDYEITFHFSRKKLRMQHHAIESMKLQSLILFPNEIKEIKKQFDAELDVETGELRSGSVNVPWFNPRLNIVQKKAVANILQGVARPTPYIIFGPPGTGKTVTLIETMLQILKNVPKCRILVTTPSNSAADLITERIVESGVLKKNEFLRLVSHTTVNRGSIPHTIFAHCGTIERAVDKSIAYEVAENGMKIKCSTKWLKSHRMLIGTCITLGTLMELDIDKEYFTHVIIDECGQSKETESIIPMTLMDKQIGQIILAGDPQQLGPIVFSPFAKKLGLARSFMVRLLEKDLYKPDSTRFGSNQYDPRLVTRLVYNYRSVPSILNVYSDLFYDASLIAMIGGVDSEDAKILNSVTRILPNNKTNGVVFIGVNGKNERCSDSPSWYNKSEAEHIRKFFEKLMNLGRKPADIGIITPYTQQVKTIRKELIRSEAEEVKIGTVEEFQGQERRIILLSTVRTRERDLANDLRYSLGFIGHPNRMNVAISRARSLLVIFGSPKLLSVDDNWKNLMERCKANDSYVECDNPED